MGNRGWGNGCALRFELCENCILLAWDRRRALTSDRIKDGSGMRGVGWIREEDVVVVLVVAVAVVAVAGADGY